MTWSQEGTTNPLGVLDAEERARRFSEGPPKFPRKYIWVAIGVAAVLGIGGAFADNSFNVTPSTPKPSTTKSVAKVPVTTAHFVGLRELGDKRAPALGLIDQHGMVFSLNAVRHHPVVLTFLDPRCADICPVVGAELLQASRDLGTRSSAEVFIVVNANPGDLGAGATGNASRHDGIASLPNVYFLSGTLAALNRVWAAYGVTVEYQPSSDRLAHTNVIYLINPKGQLAFALEPFGNEADSGAFSLPATEVDRFAAGIAQYAELAGA